MSDDMGVIKPCDLCGMPYDGDEADRINAPLTQLRASLATVTAERDALLVEREEQRGCYTKVVTRFEENAMAERAAHAETRKTLEECKGKLRDANGFWECETAALESTRAALARSEARVKAALEYANGRWSEWGDRAERVRDILEGNGNGNG